MLSRLYIELSRETQPNSTMLTLQTRPRGANGIGPPHGIHYQICNVDAAKIKRCRIGLLYRSLYVIVQDVRLLRSLVHNQGNFA